MKETVIFAARTVAAKATLGERVTTKYQDHCVHYHVRSSGLAGVVITDEEYPSESAHYLLTTMMSDYTKFTNAWKQVEVDFEIEYPFLKDAVKKYQNPREADKVDKVMKEMERTKQIMYKNIEQAIGRGEDLDKLVDKSNDLSKRSKVFYKQSRKLNKCCSIQ